MRFYRIRDIMGDIIDGGIRRVEAKNLEEALEKISLNTVIQLMLTGIGLQRIGIPTIE